MPAHLKTLWRSQSSTTPSGQPAWEAAEYYYSAQSESVTDEHMHILVLRYTPEWYQLTLFSWYVRMSNHGYSSYLNVSPKLPFVRMETSFVTMIMCSVGCSQCIRNLIPATMTFRPSVKVSWRDLYKFYDSWQGLEIWPPHFVVSLTYMDGFEPPVTEG
jgi:hypothetical protein